MSTRTDDEGMTLIELLVAMAVMLVIITPLVTSFVLTLSTTTTADQEATNSSDAQSLVAYFDRDVGNADTVGVGSSCGGSSSILAATWLDGSVTHVIAYQATQDSAAQTALAATSPVYRITRYDCTGGGTPTSTILVRSASAPPTVLCDAVACSSSTTTPRTVTLSLSELGKRPSDLLLPLTVKATRRVTP